MNEKNPRQDKSAPEPEIQEPEVTTPPEPVDNQPGVVAPAAEDSVEEPDPHKFSVGVLDGLALQGDEQVKNLRDQIDQTIDAMDEETNAEFLSEYRRSRIVDLDLVKDNDAAGELMALLEDAPR